MLTILRLVKLNYLWLSGSLTQFSIDRNRLIEKSGDGSDNSNNQLISDCNFGIYWKGNHFIGFSSFNLFENKTNLMA